jgi:hypothetical protein
MRRKGAAIATHTFEPVLDCPESFTTWSDEDPTVLRPYMATSDINTRLGTVLNA